MESKKKTPVYYNHVSIKYFPYCHLLCLHVSNGNFYFLQKIVIKGEDRELELYNHVRGMEYERMKQEQAVKKLQNQYSAVKRENAVKLKEQAAESLSKEEALKQKLLRETAALEKVNI